MTERSGHIIRQSTFLTPLLTSYAALVDFVIHFTSTGDKYTKLRSLQAHWEEENTLNKA